VIVPVALVVVAGEITGPTGERTCGAPYGHRWRAGEILIGAAPWTEAAIADESVGLRELVEPDR
jgi:hypothetical protein